MRRALAGIVAAAALGALAPPASATISANFEGQYLRGNTHTFWFRATNNPGANPFYICYGLYTGNYNTISNQGCVATGLANGASGYFSKAVTGLASLADGTKRAICAYQSYGSTSGSWVCPGSDNGKLEPVTDNTAPTLTLGVGGADEYTSNTTVPVTLGYADTTSPTWGKEFGFNDTTIFQGCVQMGATMNSVCTADNQFAQYDGCAQSIAYGSGNSSSFNCSSTLTTNGKWWVCVRLTDSARDDTHATTGSHALTGYGGNLSKVCSYITVDNVKPSIGSATAMPSTATTNQSVAFAASASDATSGVKSYAWSFGDGGTANGASANHAYTTAGTKTATVTVTDNAGNTQTKDVTVTVAAPDTSAPDTTITDGPSGTTTATNATFTFTATETATFQCKLDAGSYATCSSPKAYTGLAVGSHTFSVRATDTAGNTDASPAARAWTVAAPPADPPGNGGGGGDNGGGNNGGGNNGNNGDNGGGTDSGGGGGGNSAGGGGGGGNATGGGDGPTTPASVDASGKDAPAGGTAAGTAQVGKQIAKAKTRTLTFAGLTAVVPRQVSLAALKRKLPLLLRAKRPGRVALLLHRGTRTLEKGALKFVKAGGAGFRLALGKAVAAGTFALDVRFTPAGSARTATKTFTVKITA